MSDEGFIGTADDWLAERDNLYWEVNHLRQQLASTQEQLREAVGMLKCYWDEGGIPARPLEIFLSKYDQEQTI